PVSKANDAAALRNCPHIFEKLSCAHREELLNATMGISGNLSTMHVSDLFQFMATGRKTGMLKFDRGKIVKQIYFDKGQIIGAHTNDPKEFLGQLLIHYGKLDESQLRT